MSHVDFKKWQCRPVEFKGQGPPFGQVIRLDSESVPVRAAGLPTFHYVSTKCLRKRR